MSTTYRIEDVEGTYTITADDEGVVGHCQPPLGWVVGHNKSAVIHTFYLRGANIFKGTEGELYKPPGWRLIFAGSLPAQRRTLEAIGKSMPPGRLVSDEDDDCFGFPAPLPKPDPDPKPPHEAELEDARERAVHSRRVTYRVVLKPNAGMGAFLLELLSLPYVSVARRDQDSTVQYALVTTNNYRALAAFLQPHKTVWTFEVWAIG